MAMIEDTISNLNFIKESIGKFKNEIQKFITDPSYANHNVVHLRQSIEELEKNIIKKEKNIAVQVLNNNINAVNPSHISQVTQVSNGNFTQRTFDNISDVALNLPDIYSSAYNSLKYVKKSEGRGSNSQHSQHNQYNTENLITSSLTNSNFGNKSKNKKQYDGAYERDDYRKVLASRRVHDSFHDYLNERKTLFQSKRETTKLISKYGIGHEENYNFKIKRGAGTFNYMDKTKILKYSSANKTHFQGVIYDQHNRPVITKDEINKGMLNMIYKGLVPKNADLTPAFNREGNPLRMTNKVADIYTKTRMKDVVETENSVYQKLTKKEQKEESLFITVPKNNKVYVTKVINSRIDVIKNENNNNNNNNEMVGEEKEENSNNISMLNLNLPADNKSILKTDKSENGPDEETLRDLLIQQQKIIILLFSNFKVVVNEDYIYFKSKNEEKWGIIIYLIEHLSKLFKKLNFTTIDVDSTKLEKLASDELRSFTIKDFLNCISEKDLLLKQININNQRTLSTNIRDIFIVKIQNMIRMYLARRKARQLKKTVSKVSKIQRIYKMHKFLNASKAYLSGVFDSNHNKWKEMMRLFKLNWKEIKSGPRVEIHLNSWSYSCYKNCTIEKFQEKESNQLSRLIALADPNVEIIYISPFPLSIEVLAYYFSILQTLGVENAKERFLLIVPNITDTLPPHFSLAQLLLYSIKSVKNIKEFIKGKEGSTYIVPGRVSIHDLKLSMYLEIPILMEDYEMTKTLFTKSGSKRVFELMNMALPISAWDIKTEEEFYTSLTHLIKNYLSINIWIFKIDTEHAGRGIAHVNLDKIKSFVELKKNRLNNVLQDDTKFEVCLKDILKKAIPKKAEIATGKLYRGWEEFFREFCNCKGVIESCPTGSLTNIVGSLALSFVIEPDGNVKQICSYDKLNVGFFRNFGLTSPQKTIPNLNANLLMDKLGKYLYEQGIIGYVTTEFIAFVDNQKILFWAIDLKFGFTDEIANILFCDFLYSYSSKHPINPSVDEISSYNLNINSNVIKSNFLFSIPSIIHSNIANIKMKDLVHDFRSELLIFDLEKRNGIVFNLPDILQSGMLGISGIANSERECWKLLESSINLMKSKVYPKDYKQMYNDFRTDLLEFSEIISKLKMILKSMSNK